LAAALPSASSNASTGAAFAWLPLERAGEGSSAAVFKARHRASGVLAALKVARGDLGELALREVALLGQIDRLWGPALLDAGVVPEGTAGISPRARFVATAWIEGEALDPRHAEDRERLAARVAHGVGRALAELHEAGMRHGDVKPANIVLARHDPTRDAADDRACTLVDLGLAARIGVDEVLGGTPRYFAPELLAALDTAGPEADLYALGLVLAEILDPQIAESADVAGAHARLAHHRANEPARWAEALLTHAPGGRPSASWIADRAARWLGLAFDANEDARARVVRVKRSYLAVRARELSGASEVLPEVAGLPRAWLEEALAWNAKIAPRTAASEKIGSLGMLARARWLVSLVGPQASKWPMGSEMGTDEVLADRFVALARECPPHAWTLSDVAGRPGRAASTLAPWLDDRELHAERVARLTRELARPLPHPRAIAAAEEDAARGDAPVTVALELAMALLRAGETGRAWAALANAPGLEVDAARAEVARRRGDRALAREAATRALECTSEGAKANARATLARLAWDEGRLDEAEQQVATDRSPGAAEIRALVAYRRGQFDRGAQIVDEALVEGPDADASTRLLGTRGMLEHARGNALASLAAFTQAVDLATRRGAVVEEATYLTGAAAAAADAGDIASALGSATRAGLLWERLGQRDHAARAWLSRAGALATVGATHACDEAASEARLRAVESGDVRAAAYARWSSVETRTPGDPHARTEAILADAALADADLDDRVRAAARLLVWASDAIDDARVRETDATAKDASPPARWEWWGARAAAALLGRGAMTGDRVLGELAALVGVGAPLGSRGPALAAAARLALERGDGDVARRFEAARRAAAETLFEHTPVEYKNVAMANPWAKAVPRDPLADVALAPAQIAQLESIVRALASRDRLRPLLEQVLDTMVLWSGVERGLLLLRAPDGRLVPRAARNLARHDLVGEQLNLSQGIARRALETGEPVVATDAFASLGDLHASVHALRLRSVLAVPLLARGECLGVVYLDDRARKGAFGPRELAWVRLVASQAAMAIADARDQVLLKRAVRRAERSKKALEDLLREKDLELDLTRTELARSKSDGTRYRYDAIVGRSEPVTRMLALVDRVTSSDVPVLILGDSGTGKDLIARALHANGRRSKRAFVSENCGSIPETLLESALFGHVKGAFTGASGSRAGLFEVADGGTLFLDEIGEMPLSMQAKLLRVLQDGEVRPLGGERVRHVDVRIIGATNRDLGAMVAAGSFREDLFYRLNVITIPVPSLRERAADIPLLVEHLLGKHAAGKKLRVTRAAMDKLTSFGWPGNVRQLENEIRRAVVLADEFEGRIDVSELSKEIAESGRASVREGGHGLRSRIDALELDAVSRALVTTHGNQTQAARLLGLSRFGLQKMMKRLRIDARGGVRSDG
jgi:transcriptional regulator with GAF, ATPase, and Fis domain/tetratricopeptide (TPR) repeat protein